MSTENNFTPTEEAPITTNLFSFVTLRSPERALGMMLFTGRWRKEVEGKGGARDAKATHGAGSEKGAMLYVQAVSLSNFPTYCG